MIPPRNRWPYDQGFLTINFPSEGVVKPRGVRLEVGGPVIEWLPIGIVIFSCRYPPEIPSKIFRRTWLVQKFLKSLLESSFFLWHRHLQVVERDHLPTRFHREETRLEMSQLRFLFLLPANNTRLINERGHVKFGGPSWTESIVFWALGGRHCFPQLTSHHPQDAKDQRQALSKEMHESAQQMWLEHFPHNCRWSFYLLQYPKRVCVCLSCEIGEGLEGVVCWELFPLRIGKSM